MDPTTYSGAGRHTAAARRQRIAATIAVSVGLAVIPPLISPNATNLQLGLLVGLVGLSLGLMIEQGLRGTELAEEVRRGAQTGSLVGVEGLQRELLQLTPIVNSPAECRALVEQVAQYWRRIDDHGEVPFFGQIRGTLGAELKARLADLATGAITVPVSSPYTFRASHFSGIREYRTLSLGGADYWTTPFGRTYFAKQREAIRQTGVRIERIFVLPENTLERARPVVTMHAESNVEVSIVVRELVRQEHLVYLIDRGLATYTNGVKMLIELITTPSVNLADKERLSIVQADIDVAEEGMLVIGRYAQSIEEIYRA